MERQLVLIEAEESFRLDERTKQIGRENVARARAELQKARKAALDKQATAA